ncbi:MAG: hypothetical protein GSR85_03265 [Desulfurococcales archaeon]|nr:hypothetical protein [Desulfurococcales archaeon]
MSMQARVLSLIRESIELYNRYRSPEATAHLIRASGEEVVVAFEGTFCESCGIVDWIEDLAYVMAEYGIEAELKKVIDTDDEHVKIGVFRVKLEKRG